MVYILGYTQVKRGAVGRRCFSCLLRGRGAKSPPCVKGGFGLSGAPAPTEECPGASCAPKERRDARISGGGGFPPPHVPFLFLAAGASPRPTKRSWVFVP